MDIRAIVLKEISLKEEDKIVVVFSRELGKLSLYLKGARKTKSRFLASSQLLTLSDFDIYKKENLSTVSKAEVVDSFLEIRKDYDKLYYSMYFAELIDALTIEDEKNEKLFDLIIDTLKAMQKKDDVKLIRAIFELRALSICGYMPNVLICDECNKELVNEDVYFKPNLEYCVCAKCSVKKQNKLSAATHYALKYIFYSENEKLFSFDMDENFKKELELFALKYRNYNCDKQFKTDKFLD